MVLAGKTDRPQSLRDLLQHVRRQVAQFHELNPYDALLAWPFTRSRVRQFLRDVHDRLKSWSGSSFLWCWGAFLALLVFWRSGPWIWIALGAALFTTAYVGLLLWGARRQNAYSQRNSVVAMGAVIFANNETWSWKGRPDPCAAEVPWRVYETANLVIDGPGRSKLEFEEEHPQYEAIKHFVQERMLPLMEQVRSG